MAKSKPLPPLKHLEKLVRLAFWDPTRRKTCPPKVGVGPHPEEKPVRRKGGVGPAPGRNLSGRRRALKDSRGEIPTPIFYAEPAQPHGGTGLVKRESSEP